MAGVHVPANIGTAGWGFSYQWLQGVAELMMARRRVLASVGWPGIPRRRQLLRRRSSVEEAPVARVTERRNDHVKKMRKGIKERTGGRGGIGAVWTRRNGWSPSMVAAELRGKCVQPGGVGLGFGRENGRGGRGAYVDTGMEGDRPFIRWNQWRGRRRFLAIARA